MAQTASQTATLSAPAPTSGEVTESQSHHRSDSSSLVVLGALAGGAALLAGGGSSTNPSIQPQVVVTQTPSGTSLVAPMSAAADAPLLTSSNFVPVAASLAPTILDVPTNAEGAPAVLDSPDPGSSPPGVVYTFAPPTDPPASVSDPAIQTNSVPSETTSSQTISAPLRVNALAPLGVLPNAPVAVPEPTAAVSLVLGVVLLAGLVFRGRQRTTA